MANKLKPKRGNINNLNKLPVEDGSLIFAYDDKTPYSTVYVEIGDQRLGLSASDSKNADNAKTLEGHPSSYFAPASSLSQFPNKEAFININTASDSTIKLTRANGGTVQKVINNVSHATSANIASTANLSKNSNALGGSSLSQILAQAGSGNAFTGLDTTTNNVIKLTRANGGTVQKIINNVSNASSASMSTSSNRLISRGNITAIGGTQTLDWPGLWMSKVYTNGYPISYGNLINLHGNGDGQILIGWSGGGTTNPGNFIRSKRDVASEPWTPWARIITSLDALNSSSSAISSTNNYFTAGATTAYIASKVSSLADKTAFTGLDTTTNNVIKLTRANGGTVQKTINNVANATSANISKEIYCYQQGNILYETSDTHIMKYGYLKCDSSFQNLTLLITCGFWGNQHGSAHLINFQQDTNSNSTATIQYTGRVIRIGGSTDREFYAYKDNTNKRLYLYAKVTGGNSYGKWNVTVLQSSSGFSAWVSEFGVNQNLPSGYERIPYTYPGTSDNSNALGGSSLQDILDKINSTSGSGNAFTSIDTATNNVVKLTRANGGTVQKTINNVAHATSADNANLLDNLDSSKFVYGNNSAAVNTNYDNANLIWKSGFYDLNTTGGASNGLPTTNLWHWLIQAGHRNDGSTNRYGLQITAPNDENGNLYFRTNSYSGAGTWKTVLDNHNYTSYAANKNSYNSASISNATITLGRSDGSTGSTLTVNNVSHATSATVASKIGTTSKGSSTVPVYINNGTPTAVSSINSSFAAIAPDLENADLNNIKSPGEYFAGGGNGCTNKPSGVDAFALEVRRAADGWYVQIMYASNNQQKTYIRYFNGSSWTAWVTNTTSSGNNAYNSVSVSNATLKFGRLNGATGSTVTINNVSHATSATIASTSNISKDSNALGGSSLEQITDLTGNGQAFTDVSGTGTNTLHLTRANGGTINFVVNNVSNSSTSNYSKNSGQLQGRTITTAGSGSSATFSNHIPFISGSVLEIARYIDFHGDATSRDYSLRLDASIPSKLVVTGPSASTVQASFFDGIAENSNALGGVVASSYLQVENHSGFMGIKVPSIISNKTYLSTPQSGLIPYAPSSTGMGGIGTSSWRFLDGYIERLHSSIIYRGTKATPTSALLTIDDVETGGSVNVDAALRLDGVNSNTSNNSLIYKTGTLGSGSFTSGQLTIYPVSAINTTLATSPKNAYANQQVGVIHFKSGNVIHEILGLGSTSTAITNHGLMRASYGLHGNQRELEYILDTGNYKSLANVFNTFTASGAFSAKAGATIAGGSTIDGGLYVKSGNSNVQALTSNGSFSAKSGATISGGCTIDGGLNVKSGNSTFQIIKVGGGTIQGNGSQFIFGASPSTLNASYFTGTAHYATSSGSASNASSLGGVEAGKFVRVENHYGYFGLTVTDNSINKDHLSVPINGIIPRAASSTGVGSVGTKVWPFLEGYIHFLHSHELYCDSSNPIRFYRPNYSTFFRNDDSQTYLMITNRGDPSGSWSSLRPFYITHSTGKLNSENGQWFKGGTTIDGNLLIRPDGSNRAMSLKNSQMDLYKLLSMHADIQMNGHNIKNATLFESTQANGGFKVATTTGGLFLNTASIKSPGNQQLVFAAANEANYKLFFGVLESGWGLSPNTNGMLDLGRPNHRWGYIRLKYAPNVSSDRRLKKDIQPLDNNLSEDFLLNLNPVTYKLKDDNDEKVHWGFIAQEVEETLNKIGLKDEDFAGLHKDLNGEDVQVIKDVPIEDEDGPILNEDGTPETESTIVNDFLPNGDYIYGLGYEEFIPLAIKNLQLQSEKIKTLTEQLQEKDEQIKSLNNRLDRIEKLLLYKKL